MEVVTLHADNQVILSVGGFNTPKLLNLSGIGVSAELNAFDIPVTVNAPEVGENVQDHILQGGCLDEAPEPFEYRTSAANVSGHHKSRPDLDRSDVSDS